MNRLEVKDVSEIMSRFSKEWGIPILFGAHDETSQVVFMPIDPEDLEKFVTGETVEYSWDDLERLTLPIIQVSRPYIEASLDWLEPRHIEAQLRHERGHIIIEHEIEELLLTDKQMVEYRIKAKIVDDLIWFYNQQKRPDVCHEIIKLYNHLNLEALANKHGEVNLIDLISASTRGECNPEEAMTLQEPWSKLVNYTLGKRDHKILRRMSEEVNSGQKTKETEKGYKDLLLNIYYIIFPPKDLAEYKRIVGIN